MWLCVRHRIVALLELYCKWPRSVTACWIMIDCERLWTACSRPPWTVSREDWYAGHSFPHPSNVASTLCQWRLQAESGSGQLKIGGLTRCISMRRVSTLCSSLTPLHPWQHDPPLPSKIVIDLSTHTPCKLPSPEGWEILRGTDESGLLNTISGRLS